MRPVEVATPVDLLVLAHVMAASPLLQRYGVTEEGARASLERAAREGDLLLVAREPATADPLGLAWLIVTPAFNVGAYLRLLLVAEDAQGEGLGAQLLQAAEERVRPQANHLYLLCTADNAGARHFYERHGYHLVGSLPGLVRPEMDEILYHKSLRPPSDRLPG